MKNKPIASLLLTTVALLVATIPAEAGRKKQPIPLTEAGEKLKASYSSRMESLKAELLQELPQIDDARMATYTQAREAEKAADAALKEVQKGQKEISKREGAVRHAKYKWIAGAERRIKEANEVLAGDPSPEEKAAAEKKLTNSKKTLQDGLDALEKWQAELAATLKKFSNIDEDLKQAEAKLEQAKAAAIEAVKALGIADTLESDQLDIKLATYSVLTHATPDGLAIYAQQGKAEEERIERLLASGPLLVQMAVADGAHNAKYGEAMEIYEAIQQASDRAKEGNLQRLALAVALQHAITHNQQRTKSSEPQPIDPVKRYQHYEQAFLDGELDPAFENLSVWDYRMVVDGQEPDEILTWGRKMLRNYRPDHATMDDYAWRYVALVRSDIRYGSQEKRYDQDDLHHVQNILKNGGVCGRRANIGRFMLRAFGIPTTARPQPRHAALAHWTPDGWVVCLGGGWGVGWTVTPYRKDLDFLATTQGRATGESFKKVMRAHWIGLVHGEKRAYGFLSLRKGEVPFWSTVALYNQLDLIRKSEAKTLAAVGEDIGESDVGTEKIEIAQVEITEEDRKIHTDEQGSIIIPAAATSTPSESTAKIIFTESVLGGKQLHYSRSGDAEDFAYKFEAPAAGKYQLTSRVVTPSHQQHLLVTANDAAPVDILLPYTIGSWDQTEPVTVELKKGDNILHFSHQAEGYPKGFSIKDFRLTPTAGVASR